MVVSIAFATVWKIRRTQKKYHNEHRPRKTRHKFATAAGYFCMKQRRNSSQQRFRNGAERHANRFATSASRSSSRYSLSETHATPDGHAVKQIGEHTWLIERAGIVIHKCPRNPFTGNRIFALSCGDNQFGQDFTLYEALRTVDRLLRGQSFIKQAD